MKKRKTKNPFYAQWWFWLIVIILLVVLSILPIFPLDNPCGCIFGITNGKLDSSSFHISFIQYIFNGFSCPMC